MKNKIIVLVALIATGVLLGAAVHEARRYQTESHARTVAQQKAREEAETGQAVYQAMLITRVNELHAECQKGATAYTQLGASQRSKLPEPYCGLGIVQ